LEYQLRRFRIASGKLDEFVDAWKAGVMPLRERFGFQIHGAWSIEESNEFVWVIDDNRPPWWRAGGRSRARSPLNERLACPHEQLSCRPNPTGTDLLGAR
jgi:hypothetical protein